MYPLEGGLEAAQETLSKSYVEKNQNIHYDNSAVDGKPRNRSAKKAVKPSLPKVFQ